MSGIFFKKEVRRNKETGFPVPNEEQVVLNKTSMALATILVGAFVLWRANAKRK
jgi:hypothetical protein